MANRIYNKQVTPKGYKAGGKIMEAAKEAWKSKSEDIKLETCFSRSFWI
jgi:hypothetical protein